MKGFVIMEKKVPFLDLRVTDSDERSELLEAVAGVFDHGRMIMGPEMGELERRIAERTGRRYAVAAGSGTDALFMALSAAEIGPGDEVITTSLSWIATANAVAVAGAKPVFADINDDLNIDPESVRSLITDRTKAILPVHYTGKMCRMDELTAIAQENGLLLIEDAAQAFDAKYGGRIAGSFGDLACFSMNAMKVFAACGEAGIIVTDREDLRDRLEALRYNGTVNREECIEPSLNCRMDTLQAAILLKRLERVDGLIRRRRENARFYNERLSGFVDCPVEDEGCYDVYYTYTIRAQKRDQLKEYLEAKGIETKIQHPILMPQQPAYRGKTAARFENARKLVERILCIPSSEKLSREGLEYTADHIRKFYGGAA